jgi:hypothetical protein
VNDLEKARTVPCPICRVAADQRCVDIANAGPDGGGPQQLDGVHQPRIYQAYVVAEADAHNRAVELEAEVDRLRTRLADFKALARAAIHYVNCPDAEAETGEPYDDLVHVVRVHERNERSAH